MTELKDAQTCYKKKNFGEALIKIKSFVKKSPQDPEGLYLMGLILEQHQERDNAQKYFEQCIKISPNSEKYLIHLGIFTFNNQQYSQSKEYFSKSLKVNKHNQKAYYYIGLICQIFEQFHEARQSFKKSLDLNPDFHRCKRSLKKVQRKIEKFNIDYEPYQLQKKITQVEKGIQQLSKQKSFCLKCKIDQCQYAIQECGHYCVCAKCRLTLKNCPVCGSKGKFFKVFLV